jgi:hypothetical protein
MNSFSKRVKEEWKPFEVYPSKRKLRYLISNHGNLRSYKDHVDDFTAINGGITNGFRVLKLKRVVNKKITYFNYRLSHLVANNFLEKESDDQVCILHLDYDLLNVNVNNLKWATKEEELAHRMKNPKVIAAKKKRATAHIVTNNSKLNETQVMRLKMRLADPNRKNRLKMLAKEFNISESHISDIKNGKRWSHIKVKISTVEID